MAKNNENDVSKLSFEDTIKELTGIVSKIEQGQISLENSIQQYERGMTLIKHCRQILSKAEQRIVKISEENQAENGEDEKENS
jgi:exodeoxyribonuclease VII small subunit